MDKNRKSKIMISFRGDGITGGPNVSHKRISESELKEKYEFVPLFIPAGHLGVFNIKVMKKLAGEIKNCKPDIVHFAGLELVGWYGCLACKLAGVKNSIVTIHGSTSEAIEFNKNKIKKCIMQLIERYTLKNTSYAYGVSEYVSSWDKIKKYAKNYFGTVYNISGSCDCSKNAGENSFREEAGFDKDDILIMTSGRITTEKGFDILEKVIVSGNWKKNVKFVIIGDGDYLNKMQDMIKASKMSDRVYFTGFRKDVEHILKSGDIFVMCSRHETLCISVAEACMAGLPVVAGNVGGIPEIVEDGINGFLCRNEDVTEFSEKIKMLADDKELREKFGKKGIELMSEKFNEKKIIEKIDNIYQMILKDSENGK